MSNDLNGEAAVHDGPTYPSNFLAHLLFLPVGWFVPMSYRRTITHSDTYKLHEDCTSAKIWTKFEPIWNKELKKKQPNLIKALLRTFAFDFLVIILLWTLWSALAYVNPLIMPHLTKYFVDRTIPQWQGYVYVAAIWLGTFLQITLFNVNYYRTWSVGARARSILISLIFRKSLQLAPSALGSRGMIANLMSTDAQVLLDTLPTFMMGVVAPIQIIATIGLLSREIGVYCLIPAVMILLVVPFFGVLGRYMPVVRMRVQKAADTRMKLVTEFISAIRIVKYYAWERPFLTKIDEAREAEFSQLSLVVIMNAILMSFLTSIPTLAMGFTILFYSIGHKFDLGSIFAAIAYLAYLRFPFVFLPAAYTFGTQYLVSLGRIQTFATTANGANASNIGGSSTDMGIVDGTFTWEQDALKIATTPPVLSGINMSVPKGKLVMVVGSVGSGKSSLALALLNELKMVSGSVSGGTDIAYASQEPFLISATIRSNILFGLDYDPVWYQQVVNACALVNDFCQLPAGDMTCVTEKGSNLSGGQRQRINVARAMYSKRSNYIFDDPFSAVDANVAQHMFVNICLPLRNSGNAILLITNQLHLLSFADTIHVLDHGTIVESGSLSTLLQNNGVLSKLAIEYGLNTDSSFDTNKSDLQLDACVEITEMSKRKTKRSKKRRLPDDENLITEDLTAKETIARDKKNLQLGTLVAAETIKTKAVAHAVYVFYFCSGSIFVWLLATLFNLLRAGFNVAHNVWLSRWANPLYASEFSKHVHMGAYICLVIGEVVFMICFALVMILFSLNASRNIHQKLLRSIAYATTGFFDKMPLGQLLARFSKDISLIDNMLTLQLQQSTNLGFMVLGIIVNLAIASKYAIIIIAVALTYFITMVLLYRRTSIQIQRLEAASRAPIFTHFAETLDGLLTIRSYNKSHAFNVSLMNKIDYSTGDFLTLRRLSQWFNIATNQVVNVIVVGVVLMFVLFRNYSPSSYNVSLAVSACANSMTLVTILGNFAFLFFEFEARMNAPERILEHNQYEQEAAHEIPETKPRFSWPKHGKVEFDQLTVEYTADVPVLKSLSATINPCEKIGIVGRTGAGKSTLVTSLFRMTEFTSGGIKIDGVDISCLGLFDLRSKLSIIPQVPQIFIGSLRYNLDPFDLHTDARLWEVLDMVALKEFVSSLDDGLDALAEEGGGNFSVGQRQLIAIARCILLESRILILDEATASLDAQSDALVQKMIRKHFRNRTVLTIAHRLVTIIDSDRIMVLDKGEIVEFDTPKRLLKNENGIFYDMVHASGAEMSNHLISVINGKANVVDVLTSKHAVKEKKTKTL